MMLVVFLIAFYEQQKTNSNVYITVGAIVIFMYGMMRLSANTPTKNKDNNENDI